MIDRKVKLGYASGQLGLTAFEVFIRIQLLIFYTDVVGLAPDLAGYAIGIAVFWDAVTDPLMGWISDRISWKRGRRRPYFIPGVLGAAFFIYALLSPPEGMSQTMKFFYLLVTYLGLNTFSTIFAIPHGALAAEMTQDQSERLEIYGWRLALGNLGGILAAALPIASLSLLGYLDYSSLGLILAALLVVSGYGAYRSTSQLAVAESPQPQAPLKSTLEVFRNKPFVALLFCYLICTIGVSINSVFGLYYYKYRLLLSDSETQWIIGIFILAFTFSIPLWLWASQYWSKKKSLVFAISVMGISGALLYPNFLPGEILGPMIYGVFAGLLIASVVLLDAYLADVIDYDEILSRQKRAGIYFGLWKFSEKLTRAFAIFVSGFLLSKIGFRANEIQSPEVSQKIAWIFGPGVNFYFVFGALIALRMKYTESKHSQVLRILSRRRTLKR